MSKKDFYEVLGLDRNVGQDEVKKAYRKQAMKFHPDRNPNDKAAEEKFKEIGEAYAVLSDENKRARFDRFGHESMSQPDYGGFGFSRDGFDPFELFRSVFGGFGGDIFGSQTRHSRRASVNRGNDLNVELKLTLAEIAEGTTKKVRINYLNACDDCSGTGAVDGQLETCHQCKGSGEVQQVSESFFGRMINIATCPVCRGEGTIVKNPCPNCRGEGVQREKKTISIHVPAGVSQGNYQRLRGEGNAGLRGGAQGDIIVTFNEQSHDHFSRHGDDVLCELEINFPQAVLGDTVDVNTLSGNVRMTIPTGTEPGRLFRLRGKGIKHLNSHGRGDQIVRVTIHVPQKTSGEEKKILEELNNVYRNSRGNDKPFLRKVKDFFS